MTERDDAVDAMRELVSIATGRGVSTSIGTVTGGAINHNAAWASRVRRMQENYTPVDPWKVIENFRNDFAFVGHTKEWSDNSHFYIEDRVKVLEERMVNVCKAVEALCAVYRRMSESDASRKE